MIKIARFWPPTQRGRAAAAAAAAAAEPDGLDAFGSEQSGTALAGAKAALVLAPHPAAATARRARELLVSRWTAIVLLAAGVAATGAWTYLKRTPTPAPSSQLTVETTPSGLDVVIAGQPKGRTPLTVDLPPGSYVVQIGSGTRQRVLTATLVAGRTLVERVEMPAAVVTGSLRVETEPSGLGVLVDGVQQGRSPLTVADLAAGGHQIQVAGPAGPLRRTVSVRPNETVSLIVSAAERAPSSAGGWLVVSSPLPLQLREDGEVIGSTDMDRVMLPSGDHTLEFVNDEFGYRAQRRVSIAAGKTARLALPVPEGTLSINAQPWAEVWLDGRRLGETPIGNLTTAIGSHELVFRHPELGERRTTVAVGLKQPARIGMDMRKK